MYSNRSVCGAFSDKRLDSTVPVLCSKAQWVTAASFISCTLTQTWHSRKVNVEVYLQLLSPGHINIELFPNLRNGRRYRSTHHKLIQGTWCACIYNHIIAWDGHYHTCCTDNLYMWQAILIPFPFVHYKTVASHLKFSQQRQLSIPSSVKQSN